MQLLAVGVPHGLLLNDSRVGHAVAAPRVVELPQVWCGAAATIAAAAARCWIGGQPVQGIPAQGQPGMGQSLLHPLLQEHRENIGNVRVPWGSGSEFGAVLHCVVEQH